MVVKTRSYYQGNLQRDAEAADGGDEGASRSRGRRVKIMTPSFVEASARTYKIYDPAMKTSKKNAVVAAADALEMIEEQHYYEHDDAVAKILMSLQEEDGVVSTPSTIVHHTCLNPLSPITKFVYRIQVYNINRTLHCKTAYIIYDNTTRLFHIYTIVSNRLCLPEEKEREATEVPPPPPQIHTNHGVAVTSLPEPANTIQTKYSCFIQDMVKNYIMTMIVPLKVYDYYIQDDIFGVVTDKKEFSEIVGGDESSFYDIEALINSKTSTETISGNKAFRLIESRKFWYDPAVSFSDFYQYSVNTADSILYILSQSR
jgi:hypothetical protein